MFKIRDPKTGLFSKGRIVSAYNFTMDQPGHGVKWSKEGKVWLNEKTLKAHLLKTLTFSVFSSDWEIIKVEYLHTKPINEWVDAKMLAKVLKNKDKLNQ